MTLAMTKIMKRMRKAIDFFQKIMYVRFNQLLLRSENAWALANFALVSKD